MDESPKPVAKPRWFAMPINLHAEMVHADLDAPTRDLNHEAWSFVAMHETDGRLTELEAGHLFSSSPSRRLRLVEAGFWRQVPRGFEVVTYLEINRTRAAIDERRVKHRARQEKYTRRLSEEGNKK
jgi:hypothetical protein